MPFLRQTSFLSGELAPHLWGRTDLKTYAHGLRQCKNFIISRSGPAISRPGTRLIAPGKKVAFQTARLIPYVYSDTVSFVLEMGHLYVRFFSNGEQVLDGFGDPLELSHKMTGDQVRSCYWFQHGKNLYITHPDLQPQLFYRLEDGSWYRDDFVLTVPDIQSRNLPSQAEKRLSPRLVDDPTDYLFVGDTTHAPKPWIWYYTATMKNTTTGVVFETRPVRITKWTTAGGSETDLTDSDLIVLGPDHPVKLTRPDSPDANESPLDEYSALAYNFYRGQGSVLANPPPEAFLVGYVGSTVGLDFIDDGREPNYAIRPMVPADKFEYPYNSTVKYPTCGAFFQDRMVFGGCSGKPATLNLSAAGNYLDFDRRPVPYPTMPLELELASRFREVIKAMVASQERLVVLTDSSVWSVGASGGAIAYDDVAAQVIDEVGSLGVPPLISLGRVLYSRTKGLGVRMLVPSQERSGYAPVDVTLQASHLFENPTTQKIKAWGFAEDPLGIIWVVRTNGLTFLSATQAGDSLGWSRHTTGEAHSHSVTSICTVPEGTADGVYLLVLRSTGGDYYVERMESPIRLNAATDGSCLDSCVRFEEAVSGEEIPTGTVFSGLDHLEGLPVWISGWGIPPQGPITVDSGAVTTISPIPKNSGSNAIFFIGLPYTCEMETLDVPGSEVQTKQKQVISIAFEVDRSRGLWVGQDSDHLVEWRQRTVGAGYDTISAATETVKVLVQGKWSMAARAFLRQTEPIPVTVLGVTREVDVGG